MLIIFSPTYLPKKTTVDAYVVDDYDLDALLRT